MGLIGCGDPSAGGASGNAQNPTRAAKSDGGFLPGSNGDKHPRSDSSLQDRVDERQKYASIWQNHPLLLQWSERENHASRYATFNPFDSIS